MVSREHNKNYPIGFVRGNMKIGDLVKLERQKDRPAWIGLVVETYKTKELVDRGDATTEWRSGLGVIVHWTFADRFECYSGPAFEMLEVINEAR